MHEILESVLGEGWWEGKLQEKMESLSSGTLEENESLAFEPVTERKSSGMSGDLAEFKAWYEKHARSPRDVASVGNHRNEEQEEEQRWATWLEQKKQVYQKRKGKCKRDEEKRMLVELLGEDWWKAQKAKDVAASESESKMFKFQRYYQEHARLPRSHKEVDPGKLSQEHVKERELYLWFRDQRKAKVGAAGASKIRPETERMLEDLFGKDWDKAYSHRSSETVQNMWALKALKFKEWFQVQRRIPLTYSDRGAEALNEAEKEERSWAMW